MNTTLTAPIAATPEPITVTHGNIRLIISDYVSPRTGKQVRTVQAFRGKQGKHYAYYSFPSTARMMEYVQEQKDAEDRTAAYKAEQKAKESADLAAMIETVKVGSLFAYSWGWEQTNVDFFEVVEKKGKVITLRSIGGTLLEEGSLSMSGYLTPKPGDFQGESFSKTLTAYGLTMKHGTATLTEKGKKHFTSWYG